MKKNAWTAMALGLLLTACGGGSEDTSWLYPLWVSTDVQTVDIDGDGRLDILTSAQLASSLSQREGVVTVRRQTAPGVFASPQTYSVGLYAWKLAVADIDGDGAPDLVVADAGLPAGGESAVWLLRQDPFSRGAFLPAQRLLATPYAVDDIAIGDVTGDGVPDLVLDVPPPSGGQGATLLVQNAALRGSFLPPLLIPLPGDPGAAAIGDLNGDGRPDIVLRARLSVVNYIATTALGVVYQQAGGALSPWAELPSPQTGLISTRLDVKDLNVDGLPDIAEFLIPQSTDFQDRITALVQSAGGGSFLRVDSSLADLQGLDGAALADLNGDGRPDFAIVGFYPVGSPTTVYSTLNILLQDGVGAFQATQSLPMPIAASRVASGDLNGDGLNDLVVFGAEHRVFVMFQSAAAPGTFLAPQFLD